MFITYDIDTYVECFIYMSFTYPQKKKKVLYIFHQEDSKFFSFWLIVILHWQHLKHEAAAMMKKIEHLEVSKRLQT